MTTPYLLMEKNIMVLAGAAALDLYLKEINQSLEVMMEQIDLLEKAIKDTQQQCKSPQLMRWTTPASSIECRRVRC